MFADLSELIRVSAACGLLFAAPAAVAARRVHADQRTAVIARSLVIVALLSEIVCLVLGWFRLCLPGTIFAIYGGALCIVLSRDGRVRQWLRDTWWHGVVEGGLGREQRLRIRRESLMGSLTQRGAGAARHTCQIVARRAEFYAIGVPVLLAGACSLAHTRFLNSESYARALNLTQLTLGQPWGSDGSVAFMAPIVFLSGVTGSAALRFIAPMMAAVLAFAVWIAVQETCNSRALAFAASIVLPCATLLAGSGEMRAGAAASTFWLLAVALRRTSRLTAIASAAMALLIQFIPSAECAIALAVLFLCGLSARLFPIRVHKLKPAAMFPVLCVIAAAVAARASAVTTDGPYQYEGAALAVNRIAREFPMNAWLVISPVHELALTFGRGWHMELSEFTGQFSPEQVTKSGFRFPFPVTDTFVFVERIPLATPDLNFTLTGLGRAFDASTAVYDIPQSRASLQFRAAGLVSAYARTHQVTIFYQDDKLTVYRIEGTPGT